MCWIPRPYERPPARTEVHLRTPWALCAPGLPTLSSFLLGTSYLPLWEVAFGDRVVALRPKGLSTLRGQSPTPLLYRFGRLPLRGRMHTPMRTLSGGRTYVHTCDRTRADGLSTPLRGVLFYQKKSFGIVEKKLVSL